MPSATLDKEATYTPNLLQEIFHRADFPIIHMYGANKVGKSRAGTNEILYIMHGEHPWRKTPSPAKVWIVSPDFKQGKSALLGHSGADTRFAEFTRWLEGYQRFNPRINKQDYTVINDLGSLLEFRSSQQGEESMAGAKVHCVLFDEPPDKAVYEECTMRLIDYRGSLRTTMTAVKGIADWTHEEIWLKRGEPWGTREQIGALVGREWLERLMDKRIAIFGDDGYLLNHAGNWAGYHKDMQRRLPYGNPALYFNPETQSLLINGSIYDNINQETGEWNLDAGYIRQREKALSKASVSIRLDGWPSMFEGLVFADSWDPALQIIAPPPEMLDPEGNIRVPKGWRAFRGIDWGWSKAHPLICVWLCQSPENVWYIYREYKTEDAANVNYKREIVKASGSEEYYLTIVDPRSPENIARLGRDDGDGYIHCVGGPGGHGDRMARYEVVGEMLAMGRLFILKDTVTGVPVAPTFIENMNRFSWPQNTSAVAKDQPLDKNNDAIDAVGYPLLKMHILLPPEKQEAASKMTAAEQELRAIWKQTHSDIKEYEQELKECQEAEAEMQNDYYDYGGGDELWLSNLLY